MRYRPIVLAAAVLVTACNRGDEDGSNERKTAAGEVLGGSISDAMLPLDTATSQSPPLRESPADDVAKGPKSDAKAATAADDKSEGEPAPKPAPTATAPAEN